MQREKYFSHSWALLTRDKGWVKPLLVMSAASFVPIAGALGNKGYAMEYARLTAWGVDAAPKQKNVDVGKCIASGWRGFVVDLGIWVIVGLALGLVGTVIGIIPGAFGDLLDGLWTLFSCMVNVIVGLLLIVAEIRTAIYEKISAGYRLPQIFEMVRRDVNGFARVFLVSLACSAITAFACIMYVFASLPMFIPFFMKLSRYGSYDSMEILSSLSSILFPIILMSLLFGFVITFVAQAGRIVTMNAAGLWMRQFDVPNWGRSEDPLPPQQPVGGPQQWQSYSDPTQHPGQDGWGYGNVNHTQQPTSHPYVAPQAPMGQYQAEEPQPVNAPAPAEDYQPRDVPPMDPMPTSQPAYTSEPQSVIPVAPAEEADAEVLAAVEREPEPSLEPEVSIASVSFEEAHEDIESEDERAAKDALWHDDSDGFFDTTELTEHTFGADDTASLKRVDASEALGDAGDEE